MSGKRGLVHIYTGDGKGKTSAALGLTVRAVGWGWKVLFVQFFKREDDPSGEKNIFRRYLKDVELVRGDQRHPLFQKEEVEEERVRASVEWLFLHAKRRLEEEGFDMVVLDEIMSAIKGGYLELEEVVGFLEKRPLSVEVVLTGRDAPPELVKRADYVTEMLKIKHPFDEGMKARKGVEF